MLEMMAIWFARDSRFTEEECTGDSNKIVQDEVNDDATLWDDFDSETSAESAEELSQDLSEHLIRDDFDARRRHLADRIEIWIEKTVTISSE
jgi:hypothetical protein